MISVIVIVKNDRGIKETLSKLVKIPKPEKTEIIVVDASEGNLDDIRKRFKSVRWIFFHNRTQKKYTIPEQRNLGIRESKGDVVIFIDANCIPEKGWLNELLKSIYEEGEYIVAGQTRSRYKTTINDLIIKRNEKKKYLDEFATINLAFKKEIIDKIGLFDERFDYGSDVDYSWRAIDAGFKIRYNPKAVIYHDWGSNSREYKRILLYGSARTRLYLKHKNRWRNIFANDPIVLIYPVLIIGLPIMIIFPYYPLLLMLLVLKNIRQPNPVGIVIKHIVYGLGVLKELISKL